MAVSYRKSSVLLFLNINISLKIWRESSRRFGIFFHAASNTLSYLDAISIFWWWFIPLLTLGSVIAVFTISKYLRVALKELSKIDTSSKHAITELLFSF